MLKVHKNTGLSTYSIVYVYNNQYSYEPSAFLTPSGNDLCGFVVRYGLRTSVAFQSPKRHSKLLPRHTAKCDPMLQLRISLSQASFSHNSRLSLSSGFAHCGNGRISVLFDFYFHKCSFRVGDESIELQQFRISTSRSQ
jgi:hypothetical protein